MERDDIPKKMSVTSNKMGNTVNFLSGEVQAILAFAVTLAKNCATPKLLSEFEEIEQKQIAEESVSHQ